MLSHIKQGTSKMEPCFCLWIFYPLRDFLPSPPPVFPSCKKEVPEVPYSGSYINPRRRKMKLSKMGRRAESWWRCIGGGRKCCLACTHRWLVTVTGSGTWDGCGSPPNTCLPAQTHLHPRLLALSQDLVPIPCCSTWMRRKTMLWKDCRLEG